MPNPASPVNVTLTPVFPAGPPVTFGLLGDSTYQQATGGTGGWQIVDRPRLAAATQWYDRAPFELQLPLRIDSRTLYGVNGKSVEPPCWLVETWMDKVPGTLQPPILSITGPVPGIQREWFLQTLVEDKALRDPNGGFRTQQDFTLTLWEYNAPLTVPINSPSPAQEFLQTLNAQEGVQAFIVYTVVAGDTLSSIAAKWLGNYARWPNIAQLNNLRDPTNLVVGQTLKLPQT